MRGSFRTVFVWFVLIVGGLYVWITWQGAPSEAAISNRLDEDVANDVAVPQPEARTTKATPPPADVDSSAVVLQVTVDNVPMENGEVVYHSSIDALEFGSGVLIPRRDASLDPRARVAQVLAGRASLRVPGGHWTWARVRTEDSALQRHVLLQPRGRGVPQHLEFKKGKPRIHVFLIDEALSEVEIGDAELHFRDLVHGGSARRIARCKSDEMGHARFEIDDAAGLYIVTPEGVGAESAAPMRATLVRRPDAADYDHVVKVARPRPVTTLQLEFTSSTPPVVDDPIQLYLENMGGGPRFFPIRYTPRGGRTEVRCAVPAGRYRLHALPGGVLAERGSGEIVEVFPHDTPRRCVVLQWNDQLCRLQLEGLHPSAFPVTVSLRDPDRSAVTQFGGKYIGPYRWGSSTATVSTSLDRRRLNVVGRVYSYVSENQVDMIGDSRTVRLTPATLVTVRVEASTPSIGEWLVLSDSRFGHESSALGRELLQAPFGAQILRSTQLLLPHGSARLVLWNAHSKQVLAERTVECRGSSVSVLLAVR